MLDYSDMIYIKHCSKVSLQFEKTKYYLNLDLKKYSLKANGHHLSLKNKEFESLNTSEFLMFVEKSFLQSNNLVVSHSIISLMTKDYMFLVATNNGEMRLENCPEGFSLGKTSSYPKNSRFIIYEASNPTVAQKPLKFNDSIMLRSASFQTLLSVNIDNHVICSGQLVTLDAIWKLVNPQVPYIPDFVFKRKYLNFNNITLNYGIENQIKNENLNSSFSGRKKNDEKSLLTLSIENQEKVLCEDLILNLIGMDGNYIKRINKQSVPNEFQNLNEAFKSVYMKFEIEPHLENKTCDDSLLYMVQKILPLTIYHDKILYFLNLSNRPETGLVCKGLCDGLMKLLREYILLLNKLENEFYSDNLDIQNMWYWTQPSLKILENLAKLCNQASFVTGGKLINIIYDQMQNTTDMELKRLSKLLIDSSFKFFIYTIKNWVCKGMLEDNFQEFFIVKNFQYTKENLGELYYDFYWDKKFLISQKNIPSILNQIFEKIFFIGKYLNIIKECGKIIYCPYENEFNLFKEESIFDPEIFNKFSSLIDKIYEWSNLSMMSLIFEQENLLSIFGSIKKLYLMECGDFYNNFIDTSLDLLNLDVSKDEIAFKTIENLIDKAIRSTSLNSDPNKELFYFSYTFRSNGEDKDLLGKFDEAMDSSKTDLFFELVESLGKIKKQEEEFTLKPENFDSDSKVFEALSLNMKVKWPLSLIISRKSLIQYRILFRLLNTCKFSEKKICEMWQIQQNFKELDIDILKPSFFLRDKMVSYIKSLIYFFFNEVIEPNYRNFVENLKKSRSLDELIFHHTFFIDTCFKQCLLDKKDILESMARINKVIVMFSNLIIRYYKDIFQLVSYYDINENINHKMGRSEKRKQISINKARLMKNFWKENDKINVLSNFNNTFEGFLKEFLEYLNKENSKENPQLINLIIKIDFNNFYYDKFFKI